MNSGALLAKYKLPLMATGAGGAVLLGLRAHKSGAATAKTTITPAPAATYDSTANDLYNSIQPQIEALQRQLANLGAGASSPIASQPGGAGNPPVPRPITTYPVKNPYGSTQTWAASQTPPAMPGAAPGAAVMAMGIPGVWRTIDARTAADKPRLAAQFGVAPTAQRNPRPLPVESA